MVALVVSRPLRAVWRRSSVVVACCVMRCKLQDGGLSLSLLREDVCERADDGECSGLRVIASLPRTISSDDAMALGTFLQCGSACGPSAFSEWSNCKWGWL